MVAQQQGLCPSQSRPAGREWLLATHVGTHSQAPVDDLCTVFMPGLQVFPERRGNGGRVLMWQSLYVLARVTTFSQLSQLSLPAAQSRAQIGQPIAEELGAWVAEGPRRV